MSYFDDLLTRPSATSAKTFATENPVETFTGYRDTYEFERDLTQREQSLARRRQRSREARQMSIVQKFRQMAPDWQWTGPSIPNTKPSFQDVAVARDGRIWVRLPQPGYLAETADPDDPSDVDEWAEPPVWDVFEPDGTYLGQVYGPDNLQTHPEPILGRDHVWAVTTDELDVEYVTRFRIEMGSLEGSSE